jgi:hypothetical protein
MIMPEQQQQCGGLNLRLAVLLDLYGPAADACCKVMLSHIQ